jgi:hypothetical protein
MKQFNSLRFLILIFGLFSIISTNAQVQTPRFISIPGASSNGFYEYLPLGYNPAGTKTYPLLLFIHGAGECGNGTTDLPLILRHGPPNMINWNTLAPGTFPDSFVVNGVSHRFIVISPQFTSWVSAPQINAVLNYVIANYKVNINKIYLTGLSMGGGATWEFAGTPAYSSRIAAIAPMAGSLAPSLPYARVIANNNIATWAFQNDTDFVTPPWYTSTWVAYINQPPTPVPPAKLTMFRRTDHDCWSLPYTPSWSETSNGVTLSLYQWMLTFSKQSSSIILPVTLSEYKALLTGTGTTQVTVTWTTTQEMNNDHFTLERSTDGINFTTIAVISGTNSSLAHTYTFKDDSPVAGVNIYRLSQTDVDGKVKYFDTLKVSVVSKSGT